MAKGGSRICMAVVAFILAAAIPARAQVEDRSVNDGQVMLSGVPEIPQWVLEIQRPFQNIRGASVQDWSLDGSLYVTTRFAEVVQIHRVDGPGGARQQLTFFDEPVSDVQRRLGSDELLFRMDQGGGEFFQYFLLDPATGGYRRLTDGASRNSGALWSPDGSMLAYTSTRRNGRANDVWLMDVRDTSSARMLFEAPDGSYYSAADFSPDGNSLLVAQYVSVTDSRIHLLDLATGSTRLLAGGEGQRGSWVGVTPQFTADGAGVLLATDLFGNFRQLARLDLASGEIEALTPEIDWDVSSLALSPDRTRGAFVTNEGGLARLSLLDPASGRHTTVDQVPAGILFGMEFNPAGNSLAFTLNGPKTPSDAYSLTLGPGALESQGLTRWTTSEVGGLNSDNFIEPSLIEYPTFDSVGSSPRMIPAFVYRPDGPGPHPVIVSIHGGPEGQYRPGFSSTIQMWLEHLKAAVVVPNVRGSAGYGKEYLKLDNGMLREDSVRDIGALLDWIGTQPDLDAAKVAVIGGSYGGYMVLASAVHYSDRLRAAVDIVGISNFVTFLENTQDYRRDLRRVEYGDERDPAMRAHLDSISPNRHVGRITVPLLVAQGANDPRVPASESEQIVRQLRDEGRDVWYMLARNEGHGFQKRENRDLYQALVLLFFAHNLGAREGIS